jgi:hypothetical protein
MTIAIAVCPTCGARTDDYLYAAASRQGLRESDNMKEIIKWRRRDDQGPRP